MSFQLNEFLESEVKQKLSLVQKIACTTSISDKKVIGVCIYFYVFAILCSLPHSVVQIKYSLLLGSIFSWNPQRKIKKLTNNYMKIKRFFKGVVVFLFRYKVHLRHFLKNYWFYQKYGNGTFVRWWRGHVTCVIMALFVRKTICDSHLRLFHFNDKRYFSIWGYPAAAK